MLKRTLGLQKDRYSQYIGATTDFEPSLIDLSPFDPQDESLLSRGTLRKVSDRDTFLMLPDNTTPGYQHEIEDADAIESIVAPHGPTLVELYFTIIHPNFPIIEKTVFMEKYAKSHREFSPPLLAAVYILAINWWDYSEKLTDHPRPDLLELERLARATLADAEYRPKLSTIQAGLLLSQRPEGDQWAPTAQMVALGQELGLHLDCSAWKIPLWERGLRKRLAWALYMQDKWGSLVHGRPSHIFASNWAVQPLYPNDFPDDDYDTNNAVESAEYERGRLLFSQMIVLSQILAEVLETFYTLSAMNTVDRSGAQGAQLVLSLAKPVQLKLKDWYSALPACLKMDSSLNQTTSSSTTRGDTEKPDLIPTGFLHLAYFATEITLHRRIVRSLSPPPSSPTGYSSPHIDPYVQHICRSAAKTRLISAMDFVNRLTPAHLRSFWYFASKTNFALIGTFGSLLWATAPGREEAEFYRARLKEFRWTLGVSSTSTRSGSDGLRGVKGLTDFAIGMLDTSTGLLKGLPEKPVLSRRGSEMDVSVASGLGSMPSGSSLASLGGYGGFSRVPSGISQSFGGFQFQSFLPGGVSGVGSLGSLREGLGIDESAPSGLASPATSDSSEFDDGFGDGAGDVSMSYDK